MFGYVLFSYVAGGGGGSVLYIWREVQPFFGS